MRPTLPPGAAVAHATKVAIESPHRYTRQMGELPCGTLLGGFRIEELVGRGGMGAVYRARQLDLDRDVALKVISPDRVEDPGARERLVREARAAAAVEHPNVLPVHAAGIDRDRAYVVMRFVPGDDLRTRVRIDGPLAPARAVPIVVQIAEALDAIHAAGFVHRDVKPANVLVDGRDHAYVADFGLARAAAATSGLTASGQWVGTTDFAAPEQIRGDAVDARTDVYALGGVLYFLLCGKPPFAGRDPEATLWAQLAQPPPVPSDSDPALAPFDTVVTRALAKRPGGRYASAGDLGRAAVAADGGAPAARERSVARGAAASSGSVTAPARRPRHGRTRIIAALLAVLIGAGALGAAMLSADDPERRPSSPTRADRLPAVGPTFTGVGHRPRDVAYAEDRLWVLSASRPRLTQLDPATGERVGAQPFVGEGTVDLDARGHVLWTANRRRREVRRIDVRTGAIQRIRSPLPPVLVAATRDGAWVVGSPGGARPDKLWHLEDDGTRSAPARKFVRGIGAVAVGGGSVWVANAALNRVFELRPDGRTRGEEFGPGIAVALAWGAGALFATVDPLTVARFEPRTQEEVHHGIGAQGVRQLAVADGRVFVADNGGSRVVVADPETLDTVAALDVPPNPYGMTAGGGHVWVTGTGDDTVTRIDY
jgi:serine/threonine protein kinase